MLSLPYLAKGMAHYGFCKGQVSQAIAIWFCMLLTTGSVFGQASYTTTHKKAIKYYESAIVATRNRDMAKAVKLLTSALQKDSSFLEAHQLLANIGRTTGNEELQMRHYVKMALLRPNGPENPSLLNAAGRHAQDNGRYAQAASLFDRALASPNPILPELKNKLERGKATAQFALEATRHPLTISSKPLPPTVNRFPLQYTPTATADDQLIVYTARKGRTPNYGEDIYEARRDNKGNWTAPTPISPVINTPGNEGTTSISADGRTLVFTRCEAKIMGGCNIYISHKSGNQWSKPSLVDSVNSGDWDSHPSLAADGRTLFFVSARPGGYGMNDIYVAHRWKNGKWSRARNLGPTINTDDEDIMPFLHPNGSTLFFSSRGHIGMGGYDLFQAQRVWQGAATNWSSWQTPKNLGYPLNTSKDESSIFIAPDGQKAYYTLEESDGMGAQQTAILYEFALGDALKLEHRSYFAKGTVRDAQTRKPITANVLLVDNATGQTVYTVEADSNTGEYLMVLPEGNKYGLTVSSSGYLFQSKFFDFADAEINGSIQQDFDLEPLKKGAKTVLNNVFFASGSAELLPESQIELARVAELLTTNPRLKVEISGHTDSVGTTESNIALSQQRAQNVLRFLIASGAGTTKLIAKGYGESLPAKANKTEQGRALNRRIEFTILEL